MSRSTRWLVVLLEGVATADLRTGATPRIDEELGGSSAITNLRWPSGAACIDRWLELLDAQSLRQAGLQVDLRSLLLSPAWRSDDASLLQLGQRPAGPADLTCLRLRDQARAAMQFGLASAAHLDSLKRMETLIRKAEEALLEPGVEVRRLLLSYAPLVPTERSFDACAYLLERTTRRQRRELELRQSPGALQIRADNNEALAAAEAILLRGPAASQLQALSPEEAKANGISLGFCEAVLLPKTGIAFHHSPMRAAPSLIAARGRNACATMPWGAGKEEGSTLEGILDSLRVELQVPGDPIETVESSDRQALDPIASYPDLEYLFTAEPLSV
ncbi:MAG: hypothetical protein ACYTG5_03590 [Planctomycetota bacterium]|jgi:hypothetical protein